MTVLIKYVGDGAFINGLPARDLDAEDWRVIGLQGRRDLVLDSELYQVVGELPAENEPEDEAPAPEAEPAKPKKSRKKGS